MCVCVHVCVCVCVCMYVCVSVGVGVHVWVWVWVYGSCRYVNCSIIAKCSTSTSVWVGVVCKVFSIIG